MRAALRSSLVALALCAGLFLASRLHAQATPVTRQDAAAAAPAAQQDVSQAKKEDTGED